MFIKLQHEASLNNAAHGRYLVFFGIPSITQRARGAEGQRGRGKWRNITESMGLPLCVLQLNLVWQTRRIHNFVYKRA